MDDDRPGHDIHVSARGSNFPVYPSGFPVSDSFFRIRTLSFSFRIAFFIGINRVASDRKLSQQLHRAVEIFSVQTVMGVVTVSVGSDETFQVKNSEVLGYRTLGDIEVAGKGVNTERFVIPQECNYPQSAFNSQNSHKFREFLKSVILSFHGASISVFKYILIWIADVKDWDQSLVVTSSARFISLTTLAVSSR